jgi:exopolyphosphatase / guanosine-5'-triphosphate,3'-diphosphate pyrophosphatase
MARLCCALRRQSRLVRVAAIDVGTNSTRLLVAEQSPGGYRSIDRRTIITRLGQGVGRSGVLNRDALERTFETIADYAAACGEYGVDRLRVTGTSAVRDAANRDEFFVGVRRLTGREPELLTGEQEARAAFLGTASDLSTNGKLVVDIGGGSTELIAGHSEPEALVSLDIGCVRMFERHLHSDPPTKEELDELRADVTTTLKKARSELTVDPNAILVGVAGTVTQLATLKAGVPVYDPDVTHHAVMSHGDVRLLSRRLASLSIDQRKRIPALDPGRADVIVAGAEILLAVMEVFDFPEVLVSERDILDGLVIQLLEAEN